MLARRFTIVCLMTILFGQAFALLVAEASRPPHPWARDAVVPCIMDDGLVCGAAANH